MTLPDINAGCGGIDAYLGSFSFINSDQLQRFAKQIMSNAAGYFFDLALQTTVPEIKTAKDFLQKMASDINSMQTENVSGNSWNTNSSTMFGQMSHQLANGATSTQMRDGSTVTDSTQAASKTPVNINFARQIATAQQEMAREAQTQSQSALHGFNSSISSAWNTLSQFGSNRGSSDSMTQGADSTMSAQDSMMASKMRSAVESYAKGHNISKEQATQELGQRSIRASTGLYGDASAHGGIGIKAFGTGGGVSFRAGAKAGVDFDDVDSHQASSGTRSSQDARHDLDAKSTKDFKEASDYFTSRKLNDSGSHTDNNAASRADQLSVALNSAKQSYDQYTTSQARSHELKYNAQQILQDKYIQWCADQVWTAFILAAIIAAVVCVITFFVTTWILGHQGKQQSEDEITGGRQLTDDPKAVAKMLRRDGLASDIKIGELPLIKDSEIQNFCLHGTVGAGKSEVIRRLMNYARQRGDMVIVYDRSCEFVKSYYDPATDKILNPLDARCAAWPSGCRP